MNNNEETEETPKPNVLEVIAGEIEDTKYLLELLYEERKAALIFQRARGKSVYEIANLAGMSAPNVSKIVAGTYIDSSAPIPPLIYRFAERTEKLQKIRNQL